MAKRKDTTQDAPVPETTGTTIDDQPHMDFNDPETGAGHDAGGVVQDPDAEPENHGEHHADDGKPDEPEGPNHEATEEVLNGEHDGIEGAEPEKEYDQPAAEQDTDNTHQDGNNGLHQEDYIDGEDAVELGKAEAQQFASEDHDTTLLPGDIGRNANLSSESLVHSTLAPANRDETIVGEHPETEKGLRPLGPLDGQNRTDDAGRPYDGDSLHTVEKGLPVGQGVLEHIPAPTASGAVPEGILAARAQVPVSGVQRDPARLAERQDTAGDTPLDDVHHALLDHAEDMRTKGADTFLAAQVGAKAATADALVDAGLLTAQDAMGGGNFPNAGKIYKLNY